LVLKGNAIKRHVSIQSNILFFCFCSKTCLEIVITVMSQKGVVSKVIHSMLN